MHVPDKLDKLHCMYCGAEFLITEDAVDRDKRNVIENCIRKMFDSLEHGRAHNLFDLRQQLEYREKAMNIDIEWTKKTIDRYYSERYPKYRAAYFQEVRNFLAFNDKIRYSGENGLETRFLKSLQDKSMRLFNVLSTCYPGDIERCIDPDHSYYHGLQVLHEYELIQPEDIGFPGVDKDRLWRNAIEGFEIALRHDPNHAGAREALRKMGLDPDNLPSRKKP